LDQSAADVVNPDNLVRIHNIREILGAKDDVLRNMFSAVTEKIG
jgi:hypothetical protein